MEQRKLVTIPTNPKVMRFLVHLNDDCGSDVLKVQTDLLITDGNRPLVQIWVNNDRFMLLDTRYEPAMDSIEGYQEYMQDYIRSLWKDNAIRIDRIL